MALNERSHNRFSMSVAYVFRIWGECGAGELRARHVLRIKIKNTIAFVLLMLSHIGDGNMRVNSFDDAHDTGS